ncbi:hypothetical protein DFH07DRAFT_968488 [Mycena maculata]|uniref:Uncharacterized protein n=1 Tax=Mycena maculata TaxID=230809 RepID=A0AAD7I1V9_9AGAR|nr:hypothetical protein DFH07DRAFT_968488 [Mycena maculata]
MAAAVLLSGSANTQPTSTRTANRRGVRIRSGSPVHTDRLAVHALGGIGHLAFALKAHKNCGPLGSTANPGEVPLVYSPSVFFASASRTLARTNHFGTVARRRAEE